MKMILFLVAVYALIINQYYQKKTIDPLPAPVPNKTNLVASDTARLKPANDMGVIGVKFASVKQ